MRYVCHEILDAIKHSKVTRSGGGPEDGSEISVHACCRHSDMVSHLEMDSPTFLL